MLCLRCRALPTSLRPMTRLRQSTPQDLMKTTIRTYSTTLFSKPSHLPQTRLPSRHPHPTQSQSPPPFKMVPPQQQQTHLFSTSSSLSGRRTTYHPSRRVQKRRHGFLARNKSRTGRQVLNRRRGKKRKNLSW